MDAYTIRSMTTTPHGLVDVHVIGAQLDHHHVLMLRRETDAATIDTLIQVQLDHDRQRRHATQGSHGG